MRSASSLSDFRKGASPVPSYPANERNYHHWRAIDVERNSVVLNILVHPKNPQKLGTWVFSVEVVKAKSRWLVNRIYTIAVMNPPVRPATVTHELGRRTTRPRRRPRGRRPRRAPRATRSCSR